MSSMILLKIFSVNGLILSILIFLLTKSGEGGAEVLVVVDLFTKSGEGGAELVH